MKTPKFFQRRRLASTKAAKIFSTRPVYKPRDTLLRVFEVILTAAVVIGTAIFFFVYQKIAITDFLGKIPSLFTPKKVEKVETTVSFEDKLKIRLEQSGIAAQSLEKTPEGNYSLTIKEAVVFFSAKKEADNQVSTLQTVLAKAKIDSKQIKKIDFRFENLVVEY